LEAKGGETPRLVLVAAPAGFGKTTFLTQWLSEARTSQRRVEMVADMGSLEKTIKKAASSAEAERAAIRELVVAAGSAVRT
jgi:ATP/maltotriose-dependent transcriptional regulator MalT